MILGLSLAFGIISVLIGMSIFSNFQQSKLLEGENKPEIELAICILSARDNFAQRDVIRNTWLKSIQEINVKSNATILAKFVIGNEACPFPREDRIDKEACQQWIPSISSEDHKKSISAFKILPQKSPLRTKAVFSVYFKVLHDIILQRVGLAQLDDLLLDFKNLDVAMYDSVSEEEVSRVTFNAEQRGRDHHGYNYRPLPGLKLPKGYEFILELDIDYSFRKTFPLYFENTTQEGHFNILRSEFLHNDGTRIIDTSDRPWFPLVSVMFTVADVDTLTQHIDTRGQRGAQWKGEMEKTSQRLHFEQEEHGDILMVDLQDIYRNLPNKLLQCHNWLEKHFKANHVMKTDDDCWVNVKGISQRINKHHQNSMWWWGHFRRSWPVERHGKWRESLYPSPVYPTFACGSANIVSRDIHIWLSNHLNRLRHFQGEDVSMGIWLAGLEVHLEDDIAWSCDETCQQDSLVIAQLTPKEIWTYWNNTNMCDKPCDSC